MSRIVVALVLAVGVVGCDSRVGPTAASSPSEPSLAAPSTNAPTVPPTAPPVPPSPVALPNGIVAYPAGASTSPLPYLEYLPAEYGQGGERPLLVFLHGVDETADGSETSIRKILELAIPRLIADGAWPSARPFVVLMPQEPRHKSGRCNFGDEIQQFLDYAVDRYDVDESRIYLTGISCGAIGIWDYFAKNGDTRVAAAVPVAGHPMFAMDWRGCAFPRAPMWALNGALDDIIPIDRLREMYADLESCPGAWPAELKVTVYPDADHDAWTRTYDLSAGNDVFEWLLEHARASGPRGTPAG